MNDKITIRQAVYNDIDAICSLYYDTVRNVSAKDYIPEQIEVWSKSGLDKDNWKRKIDEQYFIAAEIGGVLAGFSSIAADGYLDYMYIHKDFQRIGVARALLAEIECKAREQKNAEIYSHVSMTAKGFFLKNGYEHKEDLRDIYKGILFINALMVKRLND